MSSRPIKIGVLCPYSTIYPNLAHDFIDGIWSGIPESLHASVQIVPEFVRQGEPSALKPAIEKLLGFERVDLLTGIVGKRSISEMIPTIEQYPSTALLCDLGEYLPLISHNSKSVFFNSLEYWRSEFALGYWAQKEFAGKGSVFMPIYDGGYHMHTTFRYGAMLAENTSMEYAVARFDTNPNYSVADSMMEYMEKFRKERPSYIHALFSGGEAKDFFEVFHREGLHKEIPLLVSQHMASQEILNEVAHLDMAFYSASTWYPEADHPYNNKLRINFMKRTGQMPNAYALLGFETGVIVEGVFSHLSSRDYDTVAQLLANQPFRGPRGDRHLNERQTKNLPDVDIEKVTLMNNQIQKVSIEQGKTLGYDHAIFEEIYHENVSGWLNPYLCV